MKAVRIFRVYKNNFTSFSFYFCFKISQNRSIYLSYFHFFDRSTFNGVGQPKTNELYKKNIIYLRFIYKHDMLIIVFSIR